MKENSLYDKKSLKEITGKSADWNEVAKDCVAFSNAQGGIIDYGIEDDAEEPMSEQRVPEELVVTLQNKINGRTSNVNAYGEILTHPNGGQYLRLHIARGSSAASTTSGKTATVERRIISKESIKVIQQALQVEELKQKQIICLGLIAQNETITASALIKKLNLRDRDALSPWLDKLVDDGLVEAVGQNRSKEYRVSADILKNSEYKGTTSLKRIENYRIRELIIEDLKIYNCASLMDIHERIGKEISYKKVLAQMKQLVAEGIALPVGQNRWVKYQLNLSHSHFQNRE